MISSHANHSQPACNGTLDCHHTSGGDNDDDDASAASLIRSFIGMELTGLLVAVSLFTLIMIILSYLIILISKKLNKRCNRENYQSL